MLDPGRRGRLPGAVVEQQPLRVPVRRARDRDPGAGRRELLPDARRPAPAHRRGAPGADQLAAQPDRDGDRSRRAAEDLRDDRRGEPPPRARRRQGRVALLRPGLLAAAVCAGRQARDAARGLPGRRALHDHPRRGVEELRRHRAARRLGGDAAGGAPADGGHPRPRRRVGAAARAGGDGGAARRRRRPSPPTSARCAPASSSASTGWRRGSRRCAPTATRSRRSRPQGAIYLSVRVAIPGQTNEATRQLLLDAAGLALVPFQAFGLREDSGWFRISVGAVSLAEIDAALPAPAGRAAAALSVDVAQRRRRREPGSASRSSCASGGVPVRREQARRRADARADRRAHGARSRERRRPAHVLPVRTAAHDADAAVHRAGSAGAAIVALSCRCSPASRCCFPFLAFARRLVGQRGRRAGDVRAGAVAAARAGVDDRRQRGAVPAALGLRAGATARRARRAGACGRSPSPGCSRRWRPSRATTRGWRCRSSVLAAWRVRAAAIAARCCPGWRCSRCARRRCRSPGWPGARARAAIRSSSRTTS